MKNISLLYTTTPTYEDAYRISNILLENKLIACANIFSNITSVYVWEDEIHNNTECAIILKTTNDLVQHATNKIQAIHPYDTPAIITIDPTNANDKFIQWVNDCTAL
ncbi:divalent-cation tolerance protein CutA [Ehrlichia chaffeensis str. Heartland]|uniref:Divalent ion tolerance protein CutA1 n=2 Tax=Ehrlichia chaffeensis (strain ATCC CRL-10679 / Arkansas) TaxID=205920 RepID=Q2GG79_EHRCR|nr:divalent-cation tolerance protein CutA [Ehrlichia chaffeensis]ABD45331.1 divalent ion tolerance protein CutA1 [Ehrlichia chaffeensis str. Arkansas]AHX03817.1 divalent-cation tolerance protein CutA [Ehrlichia chaffeensis str. Heartland]AHX05458.1 divalent-cation tolerance protein CutA [Ehrlichia chaffeensis str. Jax]AHX06446.1 divalent-cation tolerance protein CutA [Ehrlichia chaffeensis str. Liberty]AHX07618.1 divalent-cation tolerance protein CutA [Ehrlichia chaffeensis str. Osceola]